MEKHKDNTKLDDLPDILSVSNIQDFLGIGHNSAYGLITSGEIKSFKIGRLRRIYKKSLIQYLEKNLGQGAI